MKKTIISVLIIAGVCLLALALLSAGYALFSTFRMIPVGGVGPMGAQSTNGSDQFTPPQGEFTPGEGQTPPEGNFNRDDFTGQRPEGSGFPGDMSGRMGFGFSRWLSLGAYALLLLCAIAASIGIFTAKKWGAILGIIIAAALLVSGLFGLFRAFGWLNIVIPIFKILLAAAVIVLLLLPVARKAYATSKADLEDDEDDEDDKDDDESSSSVMNNDGGSNPVVLGAGKDAEASELAQTDGRAASIPREKTPAE